MPHAAVRCVFRSQPQTLTLDVPQAGALGWRAISRVLRSPVDSLGCAIFPATCVLCADPLLRLSRVPVCDSCWTDLPPQSGPLCLCCGEALGAHAFAGADRAPGDWLCRPCRVSPPRFERAVAYGLYRGTMRALLHLLKYEGMEPVARRLGEIVAAQVAALPALPGSLTVVPVPLFAAKLAQRGYNQAELLAKEVVRAGRQQGLPWRLDASLLRRKRSTESQAGLTLRQRRANMRGAFFVPGSHRDPESAGTPEPSPARDKVRERLRQVDILLIDDIYTTGATARAASMALREAGARSVWVATAARAQRIENITLPELPMHEDVAGWG
jgi:predicted amidophosphoribosyltransferase